MKTLIPGIPDDGPTREYVDYGTQEAYVHANTPEKAVVVPLGGLTTAETVYRVPHWKASIFAGHLALRREIPPLLN